MITIVVTHEDDQSDEFDFDASQATISIGRRSTNDVCIPNLSVSGRHARIAFNEGEAWVEDLNSTNGTYINNRLISRQMLNHRDELVIGKTRVRYENSTAGATLDAQVHDAADNITHDHDVTASPIARTANDQFDNGASNQFDSMDESLQSDQIDETNFESADDGIAQRPEPLGIVPKKPRVTPAQIAAASAAAVPAAALGLNAIKGESSEDIFQSLADDLSPANTRQQDADDALEASRHLPLNDLDDDLDDDLGEDGMPLTLSQKAKLALGSGRNTPSNSARNAHATGQGNAMVNERHGESHEQEIEAEPAAVATATPKIAPKKSAPATEKHTGAVIEIRNGAKSGQTLPIDKPVTTLGRPGIQIAAIMRKPDGYFLMHIESDDSVDRPTLNNDAIGDEPMLLHSGDELNVAGIDVRFNLS